MVDSANKMEFVILRLWVVYLHLRDFCEIWKITFDGLVLNFCTVIAEYSR